MHSGRISTVRIIIDVVRRLRRHMIFIAIKFFVISRKQHYRESMRNTSRHIRNHLLSTDNDVFTRVNIKSPASFPEVLFPARKQSRRAVVVIVTPFLQFPATCIDTVGPLFRFPSRNTGESRVTGPYTRSICAQLPSPHSERFTSKPGTYQRTYSIIQWKNKRRVSAHDVGK